MVTVQANGVSSFPGLDVGRVCQQGVELPRVALTNSPMSAEEPRLLQARKGGGGALDVLREAQWGQLVLCKVFMGASAETTADRCVPVCAKGIELLVFSECGRGGLVF